MVMARVKSLCCRRWADGMGLGEAFKGKSNNKTYPGNHGHAAGNGGVKPVGHPVTSEGDEDAQRGRNGQHAL